MQTTIQKYNQKQMFFKDLFIGTLIYAVTLGFFNDYTDIVFAKSFSTIFFAAAVLQALTILILLFKDKTILSLKGKHKALIAFCIWLIMFSSKFVFIWAIDTIFAENININGFFGIFAVVLAATITHKLAEKSFIILGDEQ